MAKECGLSDLTQKLDDGINSAMDSVQNSIVGDAAGGIADGISGLKSSLEGLTDGIAADIEAAVPKIPDPVGSLQGDMTALVGGLASGDPGVVLQKLDEIKEKFPGVDIDVMLGDVGIDPEKINVEKKKFDKIKQDALTTARITGQDIASGKTPSLDSVSSVLQNIGSGDSSAVKDALGLLPSLTKPGFDLKGIADSICTAVPNVEIDADGKEIKKGVETKVPSEEAKEIDEPTKKNEPDPPADADNNEKVKEAKNIDVIEANPKRQEISDKYKKLFQDDVSELKKEYKEVSTRFNKSRLFGGQKNKDRLRALALLDYIKASRDDKATGRAIEYKENDLQFDPQKIRPSTFTLTEFAAISKEADLLAKLRALENINLIEAAK